jgi:hypothetical protein
MMYGYCPTCGAEGLRRERRLNGNDTCKNGCVYPSASALSSPNKLKDYSSPFIPSLKNQVKLKDYSLPFVPSLVNQLASSFGGSVISEDRLFFKQGLYLDPPSLKLHSSQSLDEYLTSKLFYIVVGSKLVICVNYQTLTGTSLIVSVLKILESNQWTLAQNE